MISPIVSSLTQPPVRPLVEAIGGEMFGSWTPASIFDTGAQGWVYDLNDFRTMFQDAANDWIYEVAA